MERAFCAEFRSVRLHADAHSDQLNRSLQARAFTTGQDIFFRLGAYAPGTRGGQELLAHELSHVVQQNAGGVRHGASSPRTIQCKFGFEVEIQAALTKKIEKPVRLKSGPAFKPVLTPQNVTVYQDPLVAWYVVPALATAYPTVADAGDFDVKVDHTAKVGQGLEGLENDISTVPINGTNDMDNEKGAIVELVTKPLDENLDAEAVGKIMQKLVDFANAVDYGNNGRKQLKTITPTAPASMYVGMNYNAKRQKKIGEIQATQGIKLVRIPELLAQLATKAKETKAGASDRPAIWTEGAKIGEEYVKALPTSFPASHTQEDIKELRGLLSLIGNYLVATRVRTGVGWGKNKLSGLFYKSKLNEVRNNLSSNDIKSWLDTNANIVASTLVNKANVVGKKVTGGLGCEAWIEEILKGTEDQVFEANKNPYGTALGPELVGPTASQGMGAVIENRTLSLLTGQDGGYPVEKWVDVAKVFHALTRQINA